MTIISIIVVVVLSACLLNRFTFGSWNPFGLPDRVPCFGRIYYKSGNSTLSDDKNLLLISSSDNKTGKELYVETQGDTYSTNPVPTVILLKTGEGSYQTYVLSGGP